MNKTKVRVSPYLLAYRQEMAQLVNNLRDDKLRIAARVEQDLEPFTDQTDILGSDKAGLLTPPRIEFLLPEFYLHNGEVEGIIHINTSDFFGIAYIYVTLREEAGNLLESGHAMRDEASIGYWDYLPSVPLAAGTSLIVRAVAADALGGSSIAEEKLTLTEEYLRTSTDLLE